MQGQYTIGKKESFAHGNRAGKPGLCGAGAVTDYQFSAPFPYFGGKSKIAAEVWRRLGADVTNYVEPFAGSIAMLLKRPGWSPSVSWTETINDTDGLVSNFWRAVRFAADEVAHYADWPVNENDLHARHIWLVSHKDDLQSRIEGDPDYYDAKIAGWWVWGMCCWIGSGFCSGKGPWQQVEVDGEMRLINTNATEQGVNRQRVHLGDNGRGVNRQRVHLGNNGGGQAGLGENGLLAWMEALQARLRRVRVASGDWSRVCGTVPTTALGTTAIFLDPPYSDDAKRNMDLYRLDDGDVAHDVRAWAIENGDNPKMRIALCGYDSEHGEHMPPGWVAHEWKANGGYGSQGNGAGRDNAAREVIWFSPHCRKPKKNFDDLPIFGGVQS